MLIEKVINKKKLIKGKKRFCIFFIPAFLLLFIVSIRFIFKYEINELIKKTKEKNKKIKNVDGKYINVAYAFDNNYYYITHVSMKSIMLNQNKETFIMFHIVVSKEIYNEQKPVIDKICEEHKNCKINYYIIGDEFNDFSPRGLIITRTRGIFYRLLLPNLLKNESKTLYFDCDTIIIKDLTEMYNYNITNKYYIGNYEGRPLRKYGNNLRNFINSGVILVNLDDLRKDNIVDKMIEFLRKYNNQLYFLDQDVINVVCNEKNDFFPPNYISSGICGKNQLKHAQNLVNNGNASEIIPFVYHMKGFKEKPWSGIARKRGVVCFDYMYRFYEYAGKTSYYYEILEKFPVIS